MKPLSAILCLVLASCATVPRAIIPPKVAIEQLDVVPVIRAATATKTAVREIAGAGTQTRQASESLRDQIDRTAKIAAPHTALVEPFAEIRRRAEVLAARLAFAETKEKIAIQTIDTLDTEIGALNARVKVQAATIKFAAATEDTLRTQVESLQKSDAKRIIAENKLQWWRWRFAPVALLIVTGLGIIILIRPRLF